MTAKRYFGLMAEGVEILAYNRDLHTVTVFNPRRNDAKTRIRVTRIGRPDNRNKSMDFRVTVGPPNYAEREYLKLCKRAKAHPREFTFKKYPVKK